MKLTSAWTYSILIAVGILVHLACDRSSAGAFHKAPPQEESQLRSLLVAELQRASQEDPLRPTSESRRADMDSLYGTLCSMRPEYSAPSWMREAWTVMDRLNPGGGWLQSLDEGVTKAKEASDKAASSLEEAKSGLVRADLAIRREFSSNLGFGDWEIVVREANGGYVGPAVLHEFEAIVQQHHLEGHMNYNVLLKAQGRETFKETKQGLYGPMETPRVLPVYGIPYEDLGKMEQEKTASIQVLEEAKKTRAAAAVQIRQSAKQLLARIQGSS